MAEGEKKFRAKTGWIEKPLNEKKFVIVQQGGLKEFKDAVAQAKDVGQSWIEEEGKPAHIPTLTKIE